MYNMGFQKEVRFNQAFGVVGEIRFDGPVRAAPFTLETPGNDAAVLAANIIGHAFTFVDDKPGVVQAGGEGQFAGILSNPKVYPYYGRFQDNDPTMMFIPNHAIGEFVDMGFIVGSVKTAAAPGDLIAYDNVTGELSIVARPDAGAEPVVPSGKTLVPNANVDRFPQTTATGGPILIRLTN